VLATLPDESVDAVVTDPPYLIAFMGRGWDHSTGIAGQPDVWRQVLRVLKPGGHLLAFGAPRTYHRMAVAVEDAGFEIRDSLMWLFGSGFPKSHDIGKAIDRAAGAEREVVGAALGARNGNGQNVDYGAFGSAYDGTYSITAPATPEAAEWDGWGTAMKPAHEPIILARKPLSGTVAANVLAWGVGGLNVDGCRVDMGDEYDPEKVQRQQSTNSVFGAGGLVGTEIPTYNAKGRWPANVAFDDAMVDELNKQHKGASRFFYHAKASKAERPVIETDGKRIVHPTVKPLTLMRWLVRLVTPPNGTVLDMFAGTGTTGAAAELEGFNSILIERDEDYVQLIRKRIETKT